MSTGIRAKTWLSMGILGACTGAPALDVDLSGLPAPHALPVNAVLVADSAHLVRPPLPPPPPTVLLADDFSSAALSGWVPTRPGQAEAVTLADGAVCIASPEGKRAHLPTLSQTVPLAAGQAHTLQARVRATRLADRRGIGAGVVLEVLDEAGDVLRTIDDTPRQLGDTGWEDVRARIPAGSNAAALRIVLEPSQGTAEGEACFDDVSLESLSPLGAFLSLESPRQAPHPLVRQVTLDRVTQPALLAPGGATWALPVAAGPEARLRTSIGVLPNSAASAQVCFTATEPGARVPLLSRCVSPGDGWSELELALPASDQSRTVLLDAEARGPAIGAWGAPRVVDPDPADPPMNLVLVVIDTLRADHLNVEGYETRSTSPALDRFAQSAVRYAAAQATSGWTAPSLGTVVTGQLPAIHRAGRRRVRAWTPKSARASDSARKRSDYLKLSATLPVLAEQLRDAGYDTVGFSTNNFFGPRIGFHRGFSRYQMILGNNIVGAKRVNRGVRRWLKQRREADSDDPFFLTLHVIDPHHPYRMRAPAAEGYALPEDIDLEEETMDGQTAHVLREHTPASRSHPDQALVLYDAEIRYIDGILGPLLETLADDNTAIVLLSDHGEGFGEHNFFIHGNNLYQELLHVPLWLKLPGAAPAVVDTAVSLLDVYPTFLSLAGLPLPDDLAGQPLTGPVDPARVLISEGMYNGPMRIAARSGSWKYIRSQPKPLDRPKQAAIEAVREELFALSDDPAEEDNRIDTAPEAAAPLREAVLSHQSATLRGIHLRCGGPVEATVAVGVVVAAVELLDAVDGSGTLSLSPDRSKVTISSSAPLHVVLRTTEAVETVSVDAGDAPWFGLAPAQVAAAEAGPCQVWSVAGEDEAGEMSEQDAEELRALGYLE